MAKNKVIIITRNADGKEKEEELAKSKLVKLPKGMLKQVHIEIIKKQKENRK